MYVFIHSSIHLFNYLLQIVFTYNNTVYGLSEFFCFIVVLSSVMKQCLEIGIWKYSISANQSTFRADLP